MFVAAANKIGPLIPEAILGPVSEATGIPAHFLYGAGESQVVAPDGTVLAMASKEKEEVVWADIDVSEADERVFADGTALADARRPELYGAIAVDPSTQAEQGVSGKDSFQAGVFEPVETGGPALEQACALLSSHSAETLAWLALPELFCCPDGSASSLEEAMKRGELAIAQLSAACSDGQYVSTSVVRGTDDGPALQAVLVGSDGVILAQGLVHASARHTWSALSSEIKVIDLPLGRVALVPGPDSRLPEMFRLLALEGVEVAAVPLDPAERWELQTGLVERAAENRINLLVAARSSAHGNGFIASLQGDFTVLTPWVERKFDGLLSQPELNHASEPGTPLIATVHPRHIRPTRSFPWARTFFVGAPGTWPGPLPGFNNWTIFMTDEQPSLPQTLSEQTLSRIIDRFGLEESTADDGGPALRLVSQLPMVQGEIGDMRIYHGGPLHQLVTVRIVVPAMQLDSHMLFAFMPSHSGIPHYTVDSVAAGGHFAFHLDLIPRLDLGSHLSYMDEVFTPLTESYEKGTALEGLSAAQLGRRQWAIMSPWMLAYRADEKAFSNITDTVNEYLAHWFTLVEQGVSDEAMEGVNGEAVAARDGRNKAIIFNPDVDKVWNQIGPLIGEEASLTIRETLASVSQ